MINARELNRLHLELECKALDDQGWMIQTPCSNPDELARVYVVQYAQGYDCFFSRDVPETIREQIQALPVDAVFHNPATVTSILARQRPCNQIQFGKSYVFPEEVAPSDYPDVVCLNEEHLSLIAQYDSGLNVIAQAVFAVIVDKRIVSTCQSSRENERAGEAWVRTLSEYRRKGYARQVTAAWGHDLQQRNKIPFYSHALKNPASEAVAHRLGLIQYIEDVAFV